MVAGKRPRKQSLSLRQAASKRSRTQQSPTPALPLQDPVNSYETQQLALPLRHKHPKSYHRPALLDDESAQTALLDWFERVSKDRVMPWRQKWIDPTRWEKEQCIRDDGLDLREVLKRRAYQVWISEIMLQQTRVETVRLYYDAWHARWPTVEDLARAEPSDVLSAWRGLGYYSRATRIHTAAKKIVSDPGMGGLLPELPAELESKVPGVGPYTAGAISSIVFGHAVPILDGNVARVLCRQMGLYANMKSKKTTDLLWETAGSLVRAAARNAHGGKGGEAESDEVPKSEIPSLWNQALMELGSTVCKPLKPNCAVCPIKAACRAYGEGEQLALSTSDLDGTKSVFLSTFAPGSELVDIEDLCNLCEPMEVLEESFENGGAANRASHLAEIQATQNTSTLRSKVKLKQSTLSFGPSNPTSNSSNRKSNAAGGKHHTRAQETIEKHVTLFPMKVLKKPIRKEECIVCIIKKTDQGCPAWLIEQRPDKGLLASLWQFPSLDITPDKAVDGEASDESATEANSRLRPSSKFRGRSSTKTKLGAAESSTSVRMSNTAPLTVTVSGLAERKELASQFVYSVLQDAESHNESFGSTDTQSWPISHVKELGSATHLFSHITLVMYVHLFEIAKTSKKSGVIPSTKNTIKQAEYQLRKWSSHEEIENENFGTGMRRCWAMLTKEIKEQ